MKKFAVWTGPLYSNNEIFNPSSAVNRDDCLAGFRLLSAELLAKGWECSTQDVFRARGAVPEVILFLDIPREPIARLTGDWAGKSKCWLLLQEPATIVPQNWDFQRHEQFEKIFTWDDKLVDEDKYFKINYAVNHALAITPDTSSKEKLCTLIAGQHKSQHPDELYSERVKAVRWFERNHPEDFDLYGRGWEEYLFPGPGVLKILNRQSLLRPMRRLLAPRFTSYRGPAETKTEVLKRYKFCICYENIRGLEGYITEKIFDCFAAGCVPVYWGAENIIRHIPGDCFIDKRLFPNYAELYRHLAGLSGQSYVEYLTNITHFLRSEQGYMFTPQKFAATIAGGTTDG
ncbi:hypothetical protein HY768_09010 [candidate division TA06 bacterium]|uniref:Fucosyltransferase C-terminal domain-containing protein n=1 Tax=candidate division TA06 bacterium TaxID=2250710 RepID=A0A933MKT9_UNCT6|nr:hypothetical protein [candidate division TA06 bacterium]